LRVNKRLYLALKDSKKRFNFVYGGASSGKSWTVAQHLIIEKLLKQRDIGILVVRKTRPEVRASCLRLIEKILNDINIPYDINRTELIITAPNGNKIYFDSIDDAAKKKSIEGVNHIWFEEATEFAEREFLQLNISCRQHTPGVINQRYLTFNPIDPISNEWLRLRTERPGPDDMVVQANCDMNPFLTEMERRQLDELINQDEEYYKIYRLGQWAMPTQIIYTNWDIVDEMPERYRERVWGLDFGYSSNPTALVEIRFVSENEIYEREHIYEAGLSNRQIIERLAKIITDKNDMIVADSAEPKSIAEIADAGYNVHPAIKGPDSVRYGINTIRAMTVHVTSDSANLIKEKRGYKWKLDKDGNPLPEPVKFRDHLMDAERYAVTKVTGLRGAGVIVGPDSIDKKELEMETEREITDVAKDEMTYDPELEFITGGDLDED